MAISSTHSGIFAFALVFSLTAGAAPRLNGRYQGGLGLLEFKTEAGRVSGRYLGSGQCPFESERRVVEGHFEGNVLVAKVTVCQSGPACAERVYPVLAFLDPEDGSLTADVLLDGGCSSPALMGKRLHLVQSQERKGGPSLAARKRARDRNRQTALEALTEGGQMYERELYAAAVRQFERSISFDDHNWQAYMGLGVASLKVGNAHRAAEALEQARDLARAQSEDNAQIYYNLACAFVRLDEKKAAVENLKRALKLDPALTKDVKQDADLRPLHGTAEFEALFGLAGTSQQQQARAAEGL